MSPDLFVVVVLVLRPRIARYSSFLNSVWERTCLRNSVASSSPCNGQTRAVAPVFSSLFSVRFATMGSVMKMPSLLIFAALTVTSFAVDPPPDGGYGNGNTAEGTEALFSLTSGTNNTAVGEDALFTVNGS